MAGLSESPRNSASKHIPLKGYGIGLSDLSRIFSRLQDAVEEQGSIEIAALRKPDDLSEEDWAEQLRIEKEAAFRVNIIIDGSNGESLEGDNLDVFESSSCPEEVSAVYMTNRTAYRSVAGNDPRNSFDLFIDFSHPPLLDPYRLASAPTENKSYLKVGGVRSAWIASIDRAVMEALVERRNRRNWLHGGFVYDYLLFFLIIPAAFLVSHRVTGMLGEWIDGLNGFVAAAFYAYILFTTVILFRVLFGYTKWAFPLLEFKHETSSMIKHRRFWYAIVCSLVAAAFYELMPL